jgi:hypothetical protein
LLVCFALCLGCGGNDGTYPVSGSVKLSSGEPLPSASIMFRAADGKTYSTGADADGQFTMHAHADASGLPPGNYHVVVQEPPSDDIDARVPPKIHPKYARAQSTDLQATVGEQTNQFDFSLDPPRHR